MFFQGALKFSKGLAIKLSKVKLLMLNKGQVLKFWQGQWVLVLLQKSVQVRRSRADFTELLSEQDSTTVKGFQQ
jgi:hypothetical protein